MPPGSTFHQSSTQPEWRSCALTASKRLRQSSTPWNSGKLMRHCASLRSLPHDSTCAVGAMMCNVKHTGAACGSISRHGLHLVSCPWQLRKHWERCSFPGLTCFEMVRFTFPAAGWWHHLQKQRTSCWKAGPEIHGEGFLDLFWLKIY